MDSTRLGYLLVPIATLLVFGVLVYMGFSAGEAFYLAFTFGITVGAIVAVSERERAITGVLAFSTLLIALAVLPSITGVPSSTLVIATPTAQIEIPTSMIPWLCLGLIAFMAVSVAVGANPGSMSLWLLSVVLVVLYYVLTDPLLKLFSIILVAVIASYPMLSTRYSLLVPIALGSKGATYQINLAEINPYAVLLLPILTFITLDPFNAIKKRVYKDIAAVISVFVVLLHVIDLFLTT